MKPTPRREWVKPGEDCTHGDGDMVGRVLRVVITSSVPYAVVRWPVSTGRHTITNLRKHK